MLPVLTHLSIIPMHQILPEFKVKQFTEQPPVSFLVIVTQTNMTPVCPSSLSEAPLSLIAGAADVRAYFFAQNCGFMRIDRALHAARLLSSTNLILITCGHMTAFLSNQREHMMEFSLSFSINTNFTAAREGWMTPDLSQSQAVWS